MTFPIWIESILILLYILPSLNKNLFIYKTIKKNNFTILFIIASVILYWSYGWPAVNVNVLSLTVSDNYFFAGIRQVVFTFSDNSNSWTAVNTGLSSTQILSLTPTKNYPYARINRKDAWRSPLSEMVTSIKHTSTYVPLNFQNFYFPGLQSIYKLTNFTHVNFIFIKRGKIKTIYEYL